MKQIRDIADTFTGHTLRTKLIDDKNAGCALIQLKDLFVGDDAHFYISQPHRISHAEIAPKQVLQLGDIVLLSKGTNNKALVYENQYKPAVAVSAFTILRLKTTHLLPAFLAWYINSTQAQEYFNANRAGTTTLNLSKKAIDELEVPVPPLAKQEMMMRLTQQYGHYKKKTAEYEDNLKLLIDNILKKHLNDQEYDA